MYKVGVIGFGKMGMLHGALINGSGKAKLVAICDKSWVMRFGFQRVYPGVKVFDDLDKMLNKIDLDIIIIATPTFNHMESVLKCIDRGCHVFVEKPLTTSFEKAKEIYDAAKKKEIIIQVGFCNRFCPSINIGKQKLDKGVIGVVKSAEAYMYIADVFEQHSGWRYSKEASGGGVLMDFGIHMLDQMCWYFGKVENVTSSSKKLYSKEVEDELEAKIKFSNGISVDFKTSWSKADYRKSYSKIIIYGDSGKMIVTDQTLEIYDIEDRKISDFTYPDLYEGAFMDIGGINYSQQIASFLHMIEDMSIMETNLKDAVYDQMIIEDMYKSTETKKTIICDKGGWLN